MGAELLAFVTVAALVICTPGQDTALTIRSTLAGGRAGGLATALGVATAQAIWTVAASAGLAALIVACEPVFVALRFAGAAYLIWLGAQSLWSAVRRTSAAAVEPDAPVRGADFRRGRAGRPARPAPRALYRQGVLSTSPTPRWRCSSPACCRSSRRSAGPRSSSSSPSACSSRR